MHGCVLRPGSGQRQKLSVAQGDGSARSMDIFSLVHESMEIMKYIKRRLATHSVIPCVLCGLIVSAASFAQDRDPDAISEEDLQELFDQKIAATHWVRSARKRAMYLLEYYELVAVGEFDSFPEGSPDDFSLLNPRDVLVEFRILKRYQGMSADSIQVELISDMLVFPGEDLSRYAKRQQVRWGQIKEAEAIRRQLETLERSLEAGEIALQEYEEETTKISVLQEQLTRDSLATSTRLIGLVHSETSYDLGGAIRPDET